MEDFLSLLVQIIILVVPLVIGLYLTGFIQLFKKSVFLKGSNVKLECLISEMKYLSHDTLRITVDLPSVKTELGLPLGRF